MSGSPEVLVRRAAPADVAAVAACQAACWREAYAGLVRPGFFDAYPEGMGVDRWERVLADGDRVVSVAVDGSGVVGFASAGPAPAQDDSGPPPRPWQLSAVYLRAHRQGRGVADRLLASSLGARPAYLWVFQDNPRAIAFYRRHGFVPDGTAKVDERWTGLPEVRMVR